MRLAMAKLDIKNLLYYVSKEDESKSKSENQLSDKKIQQILETLANQAMKEKPPSIEDLEHIPKALFPHLQQLYRF